MTIVDSPDVIAGSVAHDLVRVGSQPLARTILDRTDFRRALKATGPSPGCDTAVTDGVASIRTGDSSVGVDAIRIGDLIVEEIEAVLSGVVSDVGCR